MRRTPLATVVFALLITTAHAQSAGPPTYSVGDEWTLTNGEVLKVVRAEGGSLVMQRSGYSGCPDCVYHYNNTLHLLRVERPDGTLPTSTSGFVPVGSGWKLWDFPLEVKKEWRISAAGLNRQGTFNYTIDCRVAAYEDVTTKAGKFKAFKVSRFWSVTTLVGGRTFTWTDTVWFAPDVKTTVKYKSLNPNAPDDWELASFSLK
jgi:hypothetical protein